MSYLSEYKEINGGYVAFGGDPKGGKITRKDTECFVLSPDFKLLDESQVLLRVLRKNNMYNVDLKNVAPSGYTCKHNKGQLNGQMVVRPVWNNPRKVNHQNSPRMSNPHLKRKFVPRTVLMRYGFKTLNTARQNSLRAVVLVNTARHINTAYPRPTENSARPVSNVSNRVHSHDKRPFNKFTANKDNNFNKKVNTIRGNITTAEPRAVDDPHKALKDKGIVNSGCSKNMTRIKTHLANYQEFKGGSVAFEGSNGRITGKGNIKTGRLDFKDVYYVEELKHYNLFLCHKCMTRRTRFFLLI
nr:ribonuclease H-like domain-containing protein [Tanacetum cinerariifolium]